MATGGDLGRRVSERRGDLQLSVEEVAHRSGMSPTYLRLLEGNPAVQPSAAALLRLAAALETTVGRLSGGGLAAPPGHPAPTTARPVLEQLSAEECRRLIAPGGVGRVVFVGDRGPVALPVNFRVLDRDIVFRTEEDSPLVPSTGDRDTAFEVDNIDDALTEGWSVLVTGYREPLRDPEQVARARSLGIVPWAAGDRDTLVRIVAVEVSGRRIRHRPPDGESGGP